MVLEDSLAVAEAKVSPRRQQGRRRTWITALVLPCALGSWRVRKGRAPPTLSAREGHCPEPLGPKPKVICYILGRREDTLNCVAETRTFIFKKISFLRL